MEGDVERDSLCTIIAEEKRRHQDRELQTDLLFGTYNLEHQDVNRGEELEMIAVSKKNFSENYHAVQTSERIWSRKVIGTS